MMKDRDIIVGNYEDLQDFKKHFSPHDRVTLEAYFRMAKKKNAMMLLRRTAMNSPQMQVIIVPYQLAENAGGLREAIKSRGFPRCGWVQAIAVDSKKLFVLGDLIPKSQGEGFKSPTPKSKKRKPFEKRNAEFGKTESIQDDKNGGLNVDSESR